jgi:hypothetical protein
MHTFGSFFSKVRARVAAACTTSSEILITTFISASKYDFPDITTFTLLSCTSVISWCWKRMLKINWTYRIMNDEVSQGAREERLLLEI